MSLCKECNNDRYVVINPMGYCGRCAREKMPHTTRSDWRMFVHYVGDFARFTFEDGLFHVCDRKELDEQERAACESGGGFFPFNDAVYVCASETGRAGNASLAEFTDSFYRR